MTQWHKVELLAGVLAAGVLAAGVLVAGGCTTTNAREPSAAKKRTESAQVPLHFDIPLADGASKTIHTAFLEATVDGRKTRLIVDSGASDHVFVRNALPFADDDLKADAPGTDHGGAAVTTWRLQRPISVQIGERQQTLNEAIVIEGPPPFKAWGIGGFVAPQLLATTGFVVVDLAQRSLAVVENAPKMCADGRSPLVLTMVRGEGTMVRGEGDAERLPIVAAKWNGKDIRLMLNTGGREVEVSPAFAIAVGADQATGRGVSGEAVRGSRGASGVLTLAGREVPVASPVVREQGDAADAQVGIAFLTGAMLAFPAGNTGAVRLCLP